VKCADTLKPKGTEKGRAAANLRSQRKVERLRTSALAGLILSADRQSLTHLVIETEQSKPVYLLKHWDSEPQGTLKDVRVKEVRESKCLAVMAEIAA